MLRTWFCVCLLSTLIILINPIVHFWLHHTAHCAGSVSVERVGQGEVGWDHPQGDMHMVAARVGCKMPWMGPGGPILALAAWTGLENATLTS